MNFMNFNTCAHTHTHTYIYVTVKYWIELAQGRNNWEAFINLPLNVHV